MRTMSPYPQRGMLATGGTASRRNGFTSDRKGVSAMRQAWAYWLVRPGVGELRPVTLAEPGPEQVLVRTLHSGISRGTETLVFAGGVPASQYQRMRAPFQDGELPGPVKYGYLNVGVVEHGPA